MHLNFGVTLVALDLMLLRKIKIKLPITTKNAITEKSLNTLWSEGYGAKTDKNKMVQKKAFIFVKKIRGLPQPKYFKPIIFPIIFLID